MKKLFITVLLLITCLGSIIANDQFWIKYSNDEVVYYYANYSETAFHIYGYPYGVMRWKVYDSSWYDDSREKSRKDYDRIVEEIKSTHPEALDEYKYTFDGQTIFFKHDYIKKMGRY